MKTLYFDCSMGAAGDMLTAALIELFPDKDAMTDELNQLGIPGIFFIPAESKKCGISGTRMHVMYRGVEEGEHLHEHHTHDGHCHGMSHEPGHEHTHELEHGHNHCHGQTHDCEHAHEHSHEHTHEQNRHKHASHEHSHNSMSEIAHILSHLTLSEKVRADVLAVYDLIARAESQVHGVTMEQIHFHEVGTMDAIADITAVCYLINKLQVDRIVVSPIHVGSGQVRCAHGILPIPAPATALILKDVPIYGGEIRGELCTPTGAALLKYFASGFGPMPMMQTTAIGYGMGKKDFPAANCVRVMLGETAGQTDSIVELSCNLDDMTGEELGFAMDRLLDAGALDVFTTPINMKKSRPGQLLCVLCREEKREELVQAIFRHTTTLGIREQRLNRYTLERTVETVDTPYGPIRRKVSAGYGVERMKYEYDDLAQIAKENGLSIRQVLEKL